MNELIKRVVNKTGVSEDQARNAVNVCLAFFKEKLPAPMAGQFEKFLGQDTSPVAAAKELGSKFGL